MLHERLKELLSQEPFRDFAWRALGGELLDHDPLLIRAVRVEQHGQCQVAPLGHLHACDIADFQVVGHRRNRALVGLDDVEGDACGVGQQGAAPTAWPKRADRCQGQDAGAKAVDPAGVATITPSQISSGRRVRPSTAIESLALWRV